MGTQAHRWVPWLREDNCEKDNHSSSLVTIPGGKGRGVNDNDVGSVLGIDASLDQVFGIGVGRRRSGCWRVLMTHPRHPTLSWPQAPPVVDLRRMLARERQEVPTPATPTVVRRSVGLGGEIAALGDGPV